MKIPINLASQPFRRDRPMMVASVLVSALLVFTLGLLVYLAMLDRKQFAGLRHDVADLNRRIAAASKEENDLVAIIRKPENTTVLERSAFINYLLYHKGISWSRI